MVWDVFNVLDLLTHPVSGANISTVVSLITPWFHRPLKHACCDLWHSQSNRFIATFAINFKPKTVRNARGESLEQQLFQHSFLETRGDKWNDSGYVRPWDRMSLKKNLTFYTAIQSSHVFTIVWCDFVCLHAVSVPNLSQSSIDLSLSAVVCF